MRLVIQRVTQAKVSTEAKGVVGEIGKGLCVLVGITGKLINTSHPVYDTQALILPHTTIKIHSVSSNIIRIHALL
jgi:D-Tyr-tRNAtyr deacylase